MAWYDLFNPFWWNGPRQPIELTDQPRPPTVKAAQPRDEQSQTGSQQAVYLNQWGAFGVSGVGLWDGSDPQCADPHWVPYGDYPVWRAMDADPALTISRAVITAGIREADKSFEAREGAPEGWVKLIQDAINPLWEEFLREALDVPSMGWKPFEPVYGRRDGYTLTTDLKPLAQELTKVLTRNGVIAGLRNNNGRDKKPVDLLGPQALIVTCDGKNRDPYGRPWHENGRRAWWDKMKCLTALAKLNLKASGIQGKVFYPPAADEATAHTNETKAKSILAAYMGGQGAVFPNAAGSLTPDLAADARNIVGFAEAALWKIEIEDHGNTGAQTSAVLDDLRFHNAELSRAWHVPERAAQEAGSAGSAGSRADAEVHTDVATKTSQLLYNDICGALSRGPVDTMLVENFGEKARGAVKVKAGKLRDIYAAGDWNLIDAFLLQPEIAFALAEQIDLDAVVTRRGIPLNKGTLNLVDAIKQAVANRNKQQQALIDAKTKPQPANPVNGNGNGAAGRLALARGTEWLGRILGGDDES